MLTWKGIDLLLTNIERSDVDTRAYYGPRWMLTIGFPVSFGLMAIGSARFLIGTDLLHSGEARIMEWFEALGLLLSRILFLIALGMLVALAFLATNIIGA